MRFVVDVVPDGDNLDITISASSKTTRAEHHQAVPCDKAGESIGTVVQRILDRRPTLVVVPEGKRMTSVGVSWLAFSVVEVAVPVDLADDDALREAIQMAIKTEGLPEVVINSTLEFISPMNAYAPPKPDGKFLICPEREIEID